MSKRDWAREKVWTKGKPTEPGWYWWRDIKGQFGEEVIGVYLPDGPDTDRLAVHDDCPLESLGPSQWAGPLEPPQ